MSIELDEASLKKRVRGPDLYYASAMPGDGLKAVLGIIHGYADHGARYRHVMGALAEHGIGSVAIDMRGHGRALGRRGFCLRFDEFLDDARDLRRLVEDRAVLPKESSGDVAKSAASAERKSVPTFLFGHSFGGLVAIHSVLEDPGKLRGLVLSAPFLGLALKAPPIKLLAGRLASRIIPTLGLPSGLHGKDMTHDPARARAYDEDPLVFKNVTARWFTETVGAQERALASASKLTLPLLLAFGSADPVASMPTGKRFFESVSSKDKTWDLRDGLFHEIVNEPSWKELVESIARWITARL